MLLCWTISFKMFYGLVLLDLKNKKMKVFIKESTLKEGGLV